MNYYIGIDGGGTKTDFALYDDGFRKVAALTKGTSSYAQIGVDNLLELIKTGVDELFTDSGISEEKIEKVQICFGMPLFGEFPQKDNEIKNKMETILHPYSIDIVNDCVVGWAGSLQCENGINVVAGTGSIAYGRDNDGKVMRVGGWDDDFSDEGSCKWVGIKTMELFFKEMDGRAKKGPLYNVIMEEFDLKTPIEFLSIYEREYKKDRRKIASLQKIMLKAAQLGDEEAIKVYQMAAKELALMIKAMISSLNFTTPVNVSYSGGLFHAKDFVLRGLENELENYNVTLIEPKLTPVEGAALIAYKALGKELIL